MSSLAAYDRKNLAVADITAFSALNHFPLAAYRLPGNEKQEVICQLDSKPMNNKAEGDLMNEKGFIIRSGSVNSAFQTVIRPDFFLSGEIVHIAEEKKSEFEKLRNSFKNSPLLHSFQLFPASDIYETGKEEFCQQVESIQHQIDKGKIKKAILSRVRLVSKPVDFSLADIFNKLCIKYPDAFVSLFYLPGVGCWLGASPELLISQDRSTLQTVSLAGTKQIKETIQQAADNRQQTTSIWSEKEKEEQGIVSDYILNCLKKYFAGNIKIDGPVTSPAGSFVHLKTIFTVEDENEHLKKVFSKLVDLLHPTPAISGFPKTEALEVIKAVEKHDREFYAGFLGPVNMNDSSQLFVNLRCMQVFEDKIALYAGAGITAGSIPEKEWEETELKTTTMLEVLNNRD